MTDATHDPALASWIESANGHADFPVQNLPFGVFSPGGDAPRGGVAIGESILDLAAVLEAGLLNGLAEQAAEAVAQPVLNGFLAMGAGPRVALRHALSALLAQDAPAAVKALESRLLHRAIDCGLHLPAAIGDYTDFYAGIHHATNVGRLLRPDTPLMPNYKHLPVAYHGRASSVCPSGSPVRRPNGQRKPAREAEPSFGPSRNLDYELELGIWIGPGNSLGESIPIGQAASHVAGFCLLNDWSARDIQGWESQPLGPFLGKSFQTSISPWIVTPEALMPFRVAHTARKAGDPDLLAYLDFAGDQREGALDVRLEALLSTASMRAEGSPPHVLSHGNARQMYWTVAQMVAHHTSGGCNLRPGDLFGSGTISMEEQSGWGSLLELTGGGRKPIELPSGETRRFLEDGDEITLRAHAARPGATSIGFGSCSGVVFPAQT